MVFVERGFRLGRASKQDKELLTEDERIQQVVRLVGEDVLPDAERLITFTAYLIKNGYLQQGAFGPDSYSPPSKGFAILSLVMYFYDKALTLVKQGVPFSLIRSGDAVTNLVHLKELSAEELEAQLPKIRQDLDAFLEKTGSERLAARGR